MESIVSINYKHLSHLKTLDSSMRKPCVGIKGHPKRSHSSYLVSITVHLGDLENHFITSSEDLDGN